MQLTCLTAPSNPAARISWSLNGRPLGNNTYKTLRSATGGGWISSSNVSINIDTNSRTFVAVCHALNVELTQNIVGSHSVHVLCKLFRLKDILTSKHVNFPPLVFLTNLDPPSPPLLTGYNDGDVIISGSVKKLQCSSLGGNPPPNLTWYKNDKKLNTMSKVQDSKITSELTILVNASDNNAIYKCEIQSSAIEIPLFATKTLSIHCKLNNDGYAQ